MRAFFSIVTANRQIMVCALLLIIVTAACKKEIKINVDPPEPKETERTEAELISDSVYFYYKRYSLWTDDITPSYDSIEEYTDQFGVDKYINHSMFSLANIVLGDLKKTVPLDQFSYNESISSGGSGSARADIEYGYGIFVQETRDETSPELYRYFISFVEGNSPGAHKDIRRGDEIVRVNTHDIAGSTSSQVGVLNSALSSSGPLEIEIQRAEEPSTQTFNLVYTSYAIDPIAKDTIYDIAGKNIGYLALSSFEEIHVHGTENVPSDFKNDLIRIFNDFDQDNISDLILDLRYNIGGYVSSAIFVANKVINNAGDGELMFKYGVNEYLADRRGKYDFNDVYFSKSSNGDIQNVYFLVTEETASAAEILVSVMRPYFPNMQIIAEKTHTYGKPVGFFRQDIMGKVGLWATSFRIINATGYTDYYEGIPGTKTGVKDDVTLDFGDPDEEMIAEAIHHATMGSFIPPDTGDQGMQAFGMRRSVKSVLVKVKEVNRRKQRPMLVQ